MLSPPPNTVNAFVSAKACQTAFVPCSVSGCSKTPIGPLTNTVFAFAICVQTAALCLPHICQLCINRQAADQNIVPFFIGIGHIDRCDDLV